jgi:hypothetical protein
MNTDTQERDELASLVGFEFRMDRSAPRDWPEGTNGYTVTLTFGGTVCEWPYYMGPRLTDDPSVEDVLGSLFLDARCAEDGFEAFCMDLGYDEDSRKDYATWEACKETAERLRFLFGDRYEDYANTEWDR